MSKCVKFEPFPPFLNEELLDEDEVWVRVKVLVEAEEGPRRLEAVAGHLQLALRVHVLDQELR